MGAITIVNALACGKGGAVSLKLPTIARVELKEAPGNWDASINGKSSKPALPIQTVKRAIRKLGKNPRLYSGSVQTFVSAPVGVGLKTSSSSSIAIALATFAAFGKTTYNRRHILDCSVSASLASGVSVTGALDDAAACMLGGVNFTDNSRRRILSSHRLPHNMKVVIKVPDGGSRRASVGLSTVRKFAQLSESIFNVGMGGSIWKAMTLNGFLFSSIYGYPTSDTLEALEAGAVGAGLSGTGPAVAAVFDRSRESGRLARLWEERGATVIKAETSNMGAAIAH